MPAGKPTLCLLYPLLHLYTFRLLPSFGYYELYYNKIRVHVSFEIVVFSGYMHRLGITGSYSSSIFSFLGSLHTVLQLVSVLQKLFQFTFPLYSVGELPFLHTLQHLLFVNFLMMVILNSVNQYLPAVLISISLIISDLEHLFMCFLAIHISLEKRLFKSAHFLIVLWFF